MSKTGIDEPIRYVVLIVLKPITAATASGPLWSDAPAAAVHLAARLCRRQQGRQRAKGLKFIKDVAPNVPMRDVKVLQSPLQPTNNVE